MKVLIGKNKTVELSPACCDPVADPKLTSKAPAMPDSDDSESEEEEEDQEERGGAVGGGDVVDDGRRYAVNRKKQATSSEDENEDKAELKKDITGRKSKVLQKC